MFKRSWTLLLTCLHFRELAHLRAQVQVHESAWDLIQELIERQTAKYNWLDEDYQRLVTENQRLEMELRIQKRAHDALEDEFRTMDITREMIEENVSEQST